MFKDLNLRGNHSKWAGNRMTPFREMSHHGKTALCPPFLVRMVSYYQIYTSHPVNDFISRKAIVLDTEYYFAKLHNLENPKAFVKNIKYTFKRLWYF